MGIIIITWRGCEMGLGRESWWIFGHFRLFLCWSVTRGARGVLAAVEKCHKPQEAPFLSLERFSWSERHSCTSTRRPGSPWQQQSFNSSTLFITSFFVWVIWKFNKLFGISLYSVDCFSFFLLIIFVISTPSIPTLYKLAYVSGKRA